MKRTLATFLGCLCLLAASAWAVVNPALAGGATATCKNGSTVSCTGSDCTSVDSTSTAAGFCECTRSNGSVDHQNCDDKPILD